MKGVKRKVDKSYNESLHYVLRAGLLAGFSFYVVHLVKIKKLQYYIVPKMMPYVKGSAVALFLLAVYFVYLALQSARQDDEAREEGCHCGHEHKPPRSFMGSVALYGIFIVPLALGFVLPDKIMGSDMAFMKGMNLEVAAAQRAVRQEPTSEPGLALPSGAPTETAFPVASGDKTDFVPDASDGDAPDAPDDLFPYDEYTKDYAELARTLYGAETIRVGEEGFLEIITAVDLYRDHFIGKPLEVSGFVYREDDMAPNQFVVARMAMTCCSADAMPYGLLAESSRAAGYEKDQWITLSGVIGLTEYNGNEIIVLDARKATMIDAPQDPYVYPFFGDFTGLAQH